MTQTTTRNDVRVAQQKLTAIRSEVNSRFLERHRETSALLVGMIARQHVNLIGDPGEGKSATIEAIVARITGCTIFKIQIFPQTTIDEVFGPYDIGALSAGHLQHATSGYLPEAHIAYIDEIWNGGPSLLTGFNLALNERMYRNDGRMLPLPLETLIGASNQMPQPQDEQGRSLRATQDRISLWLKVPTLSESAHKQFLQDERARRKQRAQGIITDGSVGTTMTLDELHLLQQVSLDVDIPDVVLEGWYTIREELRKGSYPLPSTRRAGWFEDLLCASAVLRGSGTVELEDLSILQHALWQREDHVRPVQKIVLTVAHPLLAKAEEKLEVIKATAEDCITFHENPAHPKGQKTQKVIEARTSIDQVGTELNDLLNQAKGSGHATTDLESLLKEAREYRKSVTKLEASAGF